MTCTFGQLREVCSAMSRELPGYSFAPEPITEGGVQITHWPGKSTERAFKTFRFLCTDGYPRVNESTPDDSVITMPGGGANHFSVKLKAFHSAPPFTDAELGAFWKAFGETVRMPDGWRFFHMVSQSTVNNPIHW